MEQAADDLEADAQLARRAMREPEAFGLIYERYYAMILNYAFRRTMSIAAAEDVTSNTFFKALRAMPTYRPDEQGGQSTRAWLYRIASNELRMHWRWRRRHPVVSLADAEAARRVSFAPDAIAQHEQWEQHLSDFARVHEAMVKLSHPHQTVIVLRYFEQLTLEQIAGVIGKPIGSVKSQLHRATAKLKRAVDRTAPARIESVQTIPARSSPTASNRTPSNPTASEPTGPAARASS